MNKFYLAALQEAKKGVMLKHGGPFGAVVVCDNKIIARAHNQVVQNSDPTAHAEMQAIRAACKKLKTYQLDHCEMYVTAQPCPMCLTAIFWAGVKKVYYGATIFDAEKIGFDDNRFYKKIKLKKQHNLFLDKDFRKECLVVFQMWYNKKNKKKY